MEIVLSCRYTTMSRKSQPQWHRKTKKKEKKKTSNTDEYVDQSAKEERGEGKEMRAEKKYHRASIQSKEYSHLSSYIRLSRASLLCADKFVFAILQTLSFVLRYFDIICRSRNVNRRTFCNDNNDHVDSNHHLYPIEDNDIISKTDKSKMLFDEEQCKSADQFLRVVAAPIPSVAIEIVRDAIVISTTIHIIASCTRRHGYSRTTNSETIR